MDTIVLYFYTMLLLSPTHFPAYELLDSGNFEKLERFGKYVTIRPEPQAVWDKRLTTAVWEKTAHVRFVPKNSSAGSWKKLKDMPDQWKIDVTMEGSTKFTMRLGLTSFKHVGVFPEQAVNWRYIYKAVREIGEEQPKVLNLFAYTGAATLAAKAAGADVIHLDSIKQVVTWAKENMQLSALDNVRWLVEDAMTFVKREVKRGKKYHGIMLDPPAYGHGPNGENWKLEDEINEMMKLVASLLDAEKHFLILNTYSLGFSSLILDNIFDQYFDAAIQRETGEIFLISTSNQKLPLGVFARHRKGY
jgi:23S rRNA (cytosine1962-C5)-methyltransferase